MIYKKFSRTEKGYYVLGLKVMVVSGIVYMLFDGKISLCLRPLGVMHSLVGEFCLYEVMNGKTMGMLSSLIELAMLGPI